jgi:hypothetical protein
MSVIELPSYKCWQRMPVALINHGHTEFRDLEFFLIIETVNDNMEFKK